MTKREIIHNALDLATKAFVQTLVALQLQHEFTITNITWDSNTGFLNFDFEYL